MKNKGNTVESFGGKITNGSQKTGSEPFGSAKKADDGTGRKKSGSFKGDKKNSQGY